MKTILFIDGRNFLDKINLIINPNKDKNKEVDFSIYNFKELIDKTLSGINIDKKNILFWEINRAPRNCQKVKRAYRKTEIA